MNIGQPLRPIFGTMPPMDASRGSVNYQQKYKKALRSIQDIVKANKQIKEQLDSLRMMRQTEIDSLVQVQREQFRKAYDALLKEKNVLSISLQTLELENQKLKCTVSQLEHQVSIYKSEKFAKTFQNRDGESSPTTIPLSHPTTEQQSKNIDEALREKEAEFHRTLQSYEEHHSNLSRTNKRLQERLGQLENKIISTEKSYRNKLEAKELEVIDIKALTRQEFTQQIAVLRKENSALKIANNDLMIRIESLEKSANSNEQKFDWEADLVQEMIAVKSNLEPLRHQISQLQELNIYEKQQTIREKTHLRTQVMELESEVERQNEIIKGLEKKIVENHEQKLILEDRAAMMRKLEQENQLLQGKLIVMQSRQVALRNRTGEELQQRVLQFESRVQLLLNNKEGLKQLREVNIHQLLALKAYVMELDGKIRQLLNSNNYLTKKYRSYKEKYQGSLKEHKQYEMTINSLKMKILGYDKLVLKLQEELQITVRSYEQQILEITTTTRPAEDNSGIYKKKYEMAKEKLEVQEKYRLQEIETLKLNYETKIMDHTIQMQENRSLKETIELYKSKNQELVNIINKKENELYQSKRLSSLKTSNIEEPATTRQTKDIISNLHITIKQSDETIFKLQTELRTKEDSYKRMISKLQRQMNDLKDDLSREANKRQIESNLLHEQEIKKYKIKIHDLQNDLHILQVGQSDNYNKKTDDFDLKLRQLEIRVQQAEQQREEEIFGKRRVEKQLLNLQLDKDQLQATIQELQGRIGQLKRQNDDLRNQNFSSSTVTFSKVDNSSSEYELQSKDNIIRKLNNEINELREAIGEYGEKDITISSLRNQIFYHKKEIEDMNDVINKYTNQISFLKGHLDTNKANFNSGFQALLLEKDSQLTKARKQISNRELKIRQLEDEIARLQENIRKMRKDLNEIQYLRQDNEGLQRLVGQKNSFAERLKFQTNNYEQDVDKYKREISFLKDNLQKLNYELLEKEDQISKLSLEVTASNIKGRDQIDSHLSEEIQNRDRQFNKLNSDFLTLKSRITLLEEDKNYSEENFKRANTELMNIRSQYNILQDENSSLSDQIYKKNQEISKLQFSIQTLEGQISEYSTKDEQLFKIRNELFALRTSNSALEDEIYNKQASLNRAIKELSYTKNQYQQLQQEQKIKQDTINRLNYDLNNIRRNHDQNYESLQEKDVIINRLNMDLTNAKNKYSQLQQEIEERQQQIANQTLIINQLKADTTYHQDDVEEKLTQITRLSNEREVLRSEIIRLNEDITQKNVEINRLKQEVFAIRMEITQNQYEKQLKVEQEIMSFKNRINMLEHQIEDKDTELRRLAIELETSRYKPGSSAPAITQEQIQEVRDQVSKKQRELIAMKFQLDDKQFQLQSSQSTLSLLKNNITEIQANMDNDREQFQRILRQSNLRQRRANEEINVLRQDLEILQARSQVEKPQNYSISYTEEQMNIVQERLSQRQSQVNSLRNEIQDREFYIESVHSKIEMQEKLIRQLEQQTQEDQVRMENEIQQFAQREKSFREAIAQLEQANYHQQLQMQTTSINTSAPSQFGNYNASQVVKAHIEQIDRLNIIVRDLQQQISSFKIKLSSMVNQENRIEENLVTMVLLFGEIQALRDRMKIKESQINEVRKSFIQMTVAGEIQSNKMSRILALAKEGQESHDQLDYESKSEVSMPVPVGENIFIQHRNISQQNGFRKIENQQYYETSEQRVEHRIFENTYRNELRGQQISEKIYQNQNLYNQYQLQQIPQEISQNQVEFTSNPRQESRYPEANQQQLAQQQILEENQLSKQKQNIPQTGPNHQQELGQGALPQEVRSEPPAAIPQPQNVPEVQKNDFGGSLINELQKEPQKITESQARGGQIIIKIPSNSQVSLSRSLASQPPKMQAGPMPVHYSHHQNRQQVIQHHQHMGIQQAPYHSQGIVPQGQLIRVSPGRPMPPYGQAPAPNQMYHHY